MKVALALLLLGGWSLTLAAPADHAGAQRQSKSSRVQAPPHTPLNVALPATTAAKLSARPVALDEPRATRVNADTPVEATEPKGERATAGLDIRWRESREIVGPDMVSMIRNYRRDGLPVVHLYQSGQNLLAIGLNQRGLPGIYFTRHVGG